MIAKRAVQVNVVSPLLLAVVIKHRESVVSLDKPPHWSFVYVRQTEYSRVERYVVWMVVDSKAYALNSPSKKPAPLAKHPV